MEVVDKRKDKSVVSLSNIVENKKSEYDELLQRREEEFNVIAQKIRDAQTSECPIDAVGNHIVIVKDPPEINLGSLSFSESTIKEQQKATVMSVGDDVNYKLQVGDRVWIDKYVTTNREISINGVSYSIIDKCEIACRFK